MNSLKTLFLVGMFFSFTFISNPSSVSFVVGQSDISLVKYENLIINLGNNVATKAQLSYPALGSGPFPGVLLIHGSGPTDMNETLGKTYKPLWQISEYLSERGFAVLKYDKRGVGENGNIANPVVWKNATVNDLVNDAGKALNVLINQSVVDPKRISLIGHSEGTIIAPMVAIEHPTDVENIVLMGTVAQNLIDIMDFQLVKNPLLYAEKVLDNNNTGKISISAIAQDNLLKALLLPSEMSKQNDTRIINDELLRLFYAENNHTGDISIQNQLKPILVEAFDDITNSNNTECNGSICPKWLESHRILPSTLDTIGNISHSINVLLLNGENDSQTPVQQTLLLNQRLNEVGHYNHDLITYPDLGHVFYDSSIWITGFGQIQNNVLDDIFKWLKQKSFKQ